MQNYENLYYYHLRTHDKNIVKGEYDKQISKFVFYIMKYKGENEVEFKIPINMKHFRFDICLGIDFKKFSVSIKSYDKKYFNPGRKHSVKISWNMAHNKKSPIFSEEKIKSLITFYDQLDNKIFSQVKRPIRGLIKRSIYNKIFTINTFFEEIKINLFDELQDTFDELKKINLSNDLTDIHSDKEEMVFISDNETLYENLIKEINQRISVNIKVSKDFVFSKLSEIEKKLMRTFYKKEFFYVVDETFEYEEYEKSMDNNNELIPVNSIMFYNFNKKSESILKMKNSENTLVYIKNNNQFEHFTLKNTSNNKTIKIKQDPDGFNIIYENLYFSYDSIENSFYFGEVNFNEEKEGFGIEGNFIKQEENVKINFYIGNYKNNYFHGYGILDNDKYLYKGNFIDGKKNGKCEIFVKNEKEVYIGHIKENILEGKGKYSYNSESKESIYDGDFLNNTPQGKGKIIYKNFDSFEGEFEGIKKINKGVYKNIQKESVKLNYDKEGNEKKKETEFNY